MAILDLSDDEKALVSHARDCISRCDLQSRVEYTDFLSDRERAIVLEAASKCGFSDRVLCHGGYEDAERCIIAFLPEYCKYMEESELISDFPICVLDIQCSGFREHTHRDYLGSILGLGLKRSVIGDIIVGEKGFSAKVIIHKRMSSFISQNLRLVGRDGARVTVEDIMNLPCIKREYEIIRGTAASLRIDVLISEVLSVSREKSQMLISQGLVSINHKELSDKDRSKVIELCDVFTVRGSGKYRLSLIGDRNRKDRIRFEVWKYI